MTKFADLHIHTNFSDSTYSPQEVVQEAVQNGISCISITDHDTIDGVAPAIALAKVHGLEVLPGIELSTESQGKDIHILGYLFDYENNSFGKHLIQFQDARVARIEKMIQKLTEQGIDNITVEEVCSMTQANAVGRPHLAAKLIEKGWVANNREAFGKYLGEDCLAYVPKFKQTPYEAIELIRKYGGIAVLAHPMVTNRDELIPGFVEAGLGGIEVYYANCSRAMINYYEGIAQKHNLVMTGGSDAHGKVKPDVYIGKAKVPYEMVEQLKERSTKS